MSETDSEPKTKEDVYRDRNILALAFIRAHVGQVLEHHYEKPRHGWWPDTDDVNGSEWAVVWVNIYDDPSRQVGWHVPMELVPGWLPKRDPDYDGYTTEEKNDRVAHYAGVKL